MRDLAFRAERARLGWTSFTHEATLWKVTVESKAAGFNAGGTNGSVESLISARGRARR